MTPLLVVLLAAAVVITIVWRWNAFEGGHVEQNTDDAYVRGDLTPLSTKVAGIVRDVKFSDYQKVHKGDLLVELEDEDYQAQVAQATAAVAAAKAAIENNVRQRSLQDARIDRAQAGIDQANAQITAAKGQETWEDSPEGYPQSAPYKWWNWHDNYGAEPALNQRWVEVSGAKEATFKKNEEKKAS